MASGVTYQALDRLTYLHKRTLPNQGDVIAGQPYFDVYFTGGEIQGVVIAPPVRTTSATSVIVASTDEALILTSGVNTSVLLLANPLFNQRLEIKNYTGNSNTVTISGNGRNIDGQSTYAITTAYGSVILQFNGTFWSAFGTGSSGSSIPSNAILDANGSPILDANGNFILSS